MKKLIELVKESPQTFFTKEQIIKLINEADCSQKVLSSGSITIDLERYVICKNGKEYTLPRRVTELAHYLMRNETRTMRRPQILENVWGSDVIVIDRTVDVHVRLIRKTLGDCIKTVKGVGYKWQSI